MTVTEFFVAGLPLTKGDGSRVAGKGKQRGYVHAQNRATKGRMAGGLTRWLETVAWTAKMQRWVLVDGPIEMECWFFLSRERTAGGVYRGELPDRHGTGDVDKLARAILDALEDICYSNDARVTDLIARKRYADDRQPGVHIKISEVEL